MSNAENAVRAAAQSLHDAIEAAKAEGFSVSLPARVADLPRIVIGATAKAGQGGQEAPPSGGVIPEKPAEPAAEEVAETRSRRRS